MARPSASSRSDLGDAPGGEDEADAGAAHPFGFVEAVLDVVGSIPPGHVMTYGDVAAVLGSRGARMVGQIMARYGEHVPWWRVIRAGGRAPTGHERAALPHYRSEATPLVWSASAAADDAFDSYRVDLAAARWWPRTDGATS
jgi:alkylated DNA nucleotide flippase Atl1